MARTVSLIRTPQSRPLHSIVQGAVCMKKLKWVLARLLLAAGLILAYAAWCRLQEWIGAYL